jgi:WD40 repeat protein
MNPLLLRGIVLSFLFLIASVLHSTAAGAEAVTSRGQRAHRDRVTGLSFARGGKSLATGSADKTVKIWSVPEACLLHTLPAGPDPVNAVAFSPTGDLLAAATGKVIQVWNATNWTQVGRLAHHTRGVTALAFAPRGGSLVSGGQDGQVLFWNLTNRSVLDKGGDFGLLRPALARPRRITVLAVSPDGTSVVSGDQRGWLKQWSPKDYSMVRELQPHLKSVSAVCFSADGEKFASTGLDNRIRLGHPKYLFVVRSWLTNTKEIRSLVFSSDGKFLAGGDGVGAISVWETATGTKARTLKAHAKGILAMARSPEGSILASASKDGTVKFWNLEEWTLVSEAR